MTPGDSPKAPPSVCCALLSSGVVWPSSSAVGMHLNEQLAVGVSDLEALQILG